MENWSKNRRISLALHGGYALVPFLAALVAAVRLWGFVFGDWFFAIPLIFSLEGVAVTGFVMKLRGIDSPFVPARHVMPVFSLLTLTYELYVFLLVQHPDNLPVVYGFTAAIVLLFGSLFVSTPGVALGVAAVRARGNHMILATCGLLLSALQAGAVIGWLILQVRSV